MVTARWTFPHVLTWPRVGYPPPGPFWQLLITKRGHVRSRHMTLALGKIGTASFFIFVTTSHLNKEYVDLKSVSESATVLDKINMLASYNFISQMSTRRQIMTCDFTLHHDSVKRVSNSEWQIVVNALHLFRPDKHTALSLLISLAYAITLFSLLSICLVFKSTAWNEIYQH